MPDDQEGGESDRANLWRVAKSVTGDFLDQGVGALVAVAALPVAGPLAPAMAVVVTGFSKGVRALVEDAAHACAAERGSRYTEGLALALAEAGIGLEELATDP